MIGLDTNILLRFYVDDEADRPAQQQRLIAERVILSGQPLMVCKTVLLEMEWVLRGFYGFGAKEVSRVFKHLLAIPQLEVEDRGVVEQALSNADAGLDFADALHHASYRLCAQVSTFDDRKFARRATKLNLAPAVRVPDK